MGNLFTSYMKSESNKIDSDYYHSGQLPKHLAIEFHTYLKVDTQVCSAFQLSCPGETMGKNA